MHLILKFSKIEKLVQNTSLAVKGALAHHLQRHTAAPATPHPGIEPGFWFSNIWGPSYLVFQ